MISINHEKFTLPNGLDVILSQDRSLRAYGVGVAATGSAAAGVGGFFRRPNRQRALPLAHDLFYLNVVQHNHNSSSVREKLG